MPYWQAYLLGLVDVIVSNGEHNKMLISRAGQDKIQRLIEATKRFPKRAASPAPIPGTKKITRNHIRGILARHPVN